MGRFLALALPLNIAYRIADIGGGLYYLLARKDRKIVANNLRVVLNQVGDPGQIRYLTRMVFVNFGRYLVEFFRTPKIDLKYIKKHIRIEGRQNLDQALNLGKGVLLVSAHLGNWELGGMVLSILNYPLSIIVWSHKNKLVNNFFLQQRQSKGLEVIPLGSGLKRVFLALKKNQIVALLGDVDYADHNAGVRVSLFGRDTVMPKGPAAFALKTSCAIVPVFMLREQSNYFRFIIKEPITYSPSGRWEQDLNNLTQEIAKTIESSIALSPAQWFMLKPRWQNTR